MADDTSGDVPLASTPGDYGAITDLVMSHIANSISVDAVTDMLAKALLKSFTALLKALPQIIKPVAGLAGDTLAGLDEIVAPALGPLIAPALAGIFGASVDADAFKSRAAGGARASAGADLVGKYIDALSAGNDGPVSASDAPARTLAAAAVNAAIEGWFNAFLVDAVGDAIPIDWLRFKEVGQLPHEIINVLGVGRLTRTTLRPLINATAAEPMKRFANAKYRPTQLTPREIAEQLARGNIDDGDARQRLAEHGYRDDDMDAVLFQSVKFRALADLDWLVRLGKIDKQTAITELQSAGWQPELAGALLDLEQFKRDFAFAHTLAELAIAAYAEGRLSDSDLTKYTGSDTLDARTQAQLSELAAAKKIFRTRPLTPAEAEKCVKAGVLAVQDYRDAVDAAGYSEAAGDALELLLRQELSTAKDAAQHKADLAAQKAAAASAKTAAAAAAKARVDAARALKRRGTIAELERAVIRGFIPVSRLDEVLSAEFDDDTVNIIVQDVADRRTTFLAQQAKAAQASKKAANAGLSIGELQTALTDGVLTIDQITSQLTAKGLSADDVAVLEQTMQETAAAKQAANALRQKALAKTATKPLSLSNAEALVKAGHWTLAQFDSYATAQGYDEADVANLNQLVRDAMSKTAAAKTIAAKTTAANPAKGLSLAQFKSAVVLGEKTTADYGAFLTAEGYSADDTATLVAEATDAANTARAAQQRRADASGVADGSAVKLSDVTRAAQLGIITEEQYTTALQGRGYSPDDITLELDLLHAEIAAKTKPAPAAGTAEAIVASGTGTPAQTAGLKHVQVDGELAAKGLSLATVEKSVKDGLTTLDQYQSWLEANGYGQADAELLRALLASQLPTTTGG